MLFFNVTSYYKDITDWEGSWIIKQPFHNNIVLTMKIFKWPL